MNILIWLINYNLEPRLLSPGGAKSGEFPRGHAKDIITGKLIATQSLRRYDIIAGFIKLFKGLNKK